jgi:hypothetical protein
MNEYVLTTNEEELPTPQDCVVCGIAQTFTIPEGDEFGYCVDLGVPVGECVITYTVDELSIAQFEVEVTYNNNTVSSGVVSESGEITIDKNSNSIQEAQVFITATDTVTVTVNVQCPFSEPLTIVLVTVTSAPESGKFIHNEYRYTDDVFVGPLQSNLITFGTGSSSPIISQYTMITGVVGTGGFPPAGANMNMASNKIGFDTFDFDLASDELRYFRSDTLFANTVNDINFLIQASTSVAVSGSGTYYSGDFVVPSTGQYLYLVWDYRNSLPIELCSSSVSSTEACCSCSFNPPPTPITFTSCYTNDDEAGRYFSFRASEVVEQDIDISFTVYADEPYTGTATILAGSTASNLSNLIVGPSEFPDTISITSVSPSSTENQFYQTGECYASLDCNSFEPPLCPDSVLVFQICNSNAVKDDNFDVYLNDVYIGALDLNSNTQVGSVFIASLNPDLEITAPDFVCPLSLIQTYRFDPSIVQEVNVIEMRNTQINFNGNYGLVGVRNYQLSGNDLISPCTVANFVYDGDDGSSFTFNFPYNSCCPTSEATGEFDITVNLDNTEVYVSVGQLFSGLSFVIDWGDGSPTSSSSVIHTYAIAGDYTITITVSNRFNVSSIYLKDYAGGYRFSVNDMRNFEDFTTTNFMNLDNLAFYINDVQFPINLTIFYTDYYQQDTIDLTSLNLLIYLAVEESTTLTSINASGLTNLSYFSIYQNTLLTSVNVNGLVFLKYFYLGECPSLSVAPNLSSLLSIIELQIYSTSITSVSIPPATTIKYIYFYDNDLDQTSVDNTFVNADLGGVLNGNLIINGGTNAVPSSIGLAAKANLITKGWYIVTN